MSGQDAKYQEIILNLVVFTGRLLDFEIELSNVRNMLLDNGNTPDYIVEDIEESTQTLDRLKAELIECIEYVRNRLKGA